MFSVDAFEWEIPAGSRSGKIWKMADEILHVVEGSGYSLHWQVEAEIDDKYYARIAKEPTRHEFKAGDSLSRPLAASKLFPPDVVEIVAVGEESNNLEKVLLNIAEGLERRTARQLDLFVRLLEPVMLLVMAGMVLTVVIALLLPIFKLSSAIG